MVFRNRNAKCWRTKSEVRNRAAVAKQDRAIGVESFMKLGKNGLKKLAVATPLEEPS